MITIKTEKKFYTQADLLTAMSKLPENEAKNILENMEVSIVLAFMNYSSEANREKQRNSFLEILHKQLDIYNGFNKLYNMLPVIDHKTYTDKDVKQKNENVRSESACDTQVDVVE